jgi:hypothetical protein
MLVLLLFVSLAAELLVNGSTVESEESHRLQKQSSFPWEEQPGDCWGFLFHHVSGILYSARDERRLIDWTLGTIVVTGPKTLEFYEQFSTIVRSNVTFREFHDGFAANNFRRNHETRRWQSICNGMKTGDLALPT